MQLMPVAVVETWLRCTGSDAEPLRWFCGARGDVVVEQRAWRVGPDSIVVGEQLAASVFHVRDGRVVEWQRFDALAEAMRVSGVTLDDEVLAL
jgi:hypothetical protein